MDRRIIRRSIGQTLGIMALGVTMGAGAGACAPRAQQGGCVDDLDCARGESCEQITDECVVNELDVTATESSAPGTFSNEVVPFHRGEICMPTEVESGAELPVLMRPCLHPCLTVSSFEFRHTFECVGSSCDALALMWMNTASGPGGCSADAFSSFDQSQCQYGTEVEFKMSTETSNGPIRGTMRVEVPFLSNDDAASIAADPDDSDNIAQRVHQYPTADNRVQAVSIQNDNPAPPDSCRGGACTCFPIGF